MSLGIGAGDEVITTPRTFIATSSTILLLGAKPIFADVDPNSGNIYVDSIEPLINSKTKAISVVHLGGWPADMQSICLLAKKYNLKVIEDCSQAHGAKILSKHVGTFGDVATWSFCQEKIITTGGEGGMITTNNDEIFNYIWSLKDHGKTMAAIKKGSNNIGFKWLHEKIGTNFRLTEMQSAIGRTQLKKLNNWNKLRRRNAFILYDSLKILPNIRIPLPKEDYSHAWYKFYIYLKHDYLTKNINRDKILKKFINKGIPAFSGSCSEIYLEKCFSDRGLQPIKALKYAKELGETSLMFLVHPTISIEQMRDYADAIRLVLEESWKSCINEKK